MGVRSLGYIRVAARDLPAWRRYGEDVLGVAVAPASTDEILLLRLDDRPFRFRIEKAEADRYLCAGLECPTEDDWRETIERLRAAGTDVAEGDEDLALSRQVRGIAELADPAGNRIELVWGSVVAGTSFVSPQGVSGFVTGEGGFGHVVLPTTCYDDTRAFYRLLGFGDSDEMRVHFPGAPERGLGMSFMHASGPRHHTVAVGEFPAPTGLIHTMVEVRTIDEVGLALDRAIAAGVHISATLGRHTNDKMISFYMRTPAGFDIEYGCGGMLTEDWTKVTPTFTIKEDLWGHTWDFSQ